MSENEWNWPIHKGGIQSVIDFANGNLTTSVDARSDKNTKTGENLLVARVSGADETISEWRPNERLTILSPFRPRLPDARDAKYQTKLRSLLDKIISKGKCDAAVLDFVNCQLAKVKTSRLAVSTSELNFRPIIKTLPQWYCWGLLVLFYTGLDKRIGRCKLSECEKYFVGWPGKRGHAGRKQLYCCPKHSSLGRPRVYREKKRKEKKSRGIAT